MSGFYTFAYQDRVELLVDGAVYTEDGVLIDIRQKVQVASKTPIAVTGRGSADAVSMMAWAITAKADLCGSFDKTIEWLREKYGERSGTSVGAHHELVIVGISEEYGPSVWYVTTTSYVEGCEPWTVYNAGGELMGGGPVDISVVGLGNEDFAVGLRENGGILMELMRRKAAPNPVKPYLPHLYGIGGHVDHVVVSATGNTVERIVEWPDVIGQKIDPFARDAVPDAA
jgi:hypothetical protein